MNKLTNLYALMGVKFHQMTTTIRTAIVGLLAYAFSQTIFANVGAGGGTTGGTKSFEERFKNSAEQGGFTGTGEDGFDNLMTKAIGWLQIAGILLGLVLIVGGLANVAKNAKQNQPAGGAWIAFGVGVVLMVVTVASFFFANTLKLALNNK